MSIEPSVTFRERPTPEQAARHIVRLIVGHFHAIPGRILKDESLLRIFAGEGWTLPEYDPGRAYAVEHGWLATARADSVILTSDGYRAAFANHSVETSSRENPRA